MNGKMSKTKRVNRTLELVYELNAESAMTRETITVPPDFKMSELRRLLKDNRISGVPVVDGGRLIGIASIEDLINWLADDERDCAVSEKMSTGVIVAYADEPLVHVVAKLEEHGYGRLPVLSRETGGLAGIITKGDIIERLLRKLEVDYHDEEIRNYRASQFFDDIVAGRTRLTFSYEIKDRKIHEGGDVASALKKTMKRLGLHPSLVRRVSIAMYEAEMNVIIYAREAHVTCTIDQGRLEIEIDDSGPGIADVESAMQPGYSTAPEWVRELGFGAGMGLNNIRQCADHMEISSEVEVGTLLKMRFDTEQSCG